MAGTARHAAVLKARTNADLHMDTALKNTSQAKLFAIVGNQRVTVEGAG